MFMRCISMFCGIENYVLLYKSAHYEVIPDYWKRTQYSVLSFFRDRYLSYGYIL